MRVEREIEIRLNTVNRFLKRYPEDSVSLHEKRILEWMLEESEMRGC